MVHASLEGCRCGSSWQGRANPPERRASRVVRNSSSKRMAGTKEPLLSCCQRRLSCNYLLSHANLPYFWGAYLESCCQQRCTRDLRYEIVVLYYIRAECRIYRRAVKRTIMTYKEGAVRCMHISNCGFLPPVCTFCRLIQRQRSEAQST